MDITYTRKKERHKQGYVWQINEIEEVDQYYSRFGYKKMKILFCSDFFI
jgi:uncharacterized metal-binding protein